jgi:hypothetical protein
VPPIADRQGSPEAVYGPHTTRPSRNLKTSAHTIPRCRPPDPKRAMPVRVLHPAAPSRCAAITGRQLRYAASIPD